jgi:hypothetical protein
VGLAGKEVKTQRLGLSENNAALYQGMTLAGRHMVENTLAFSPILVGPQRPD